MVIVTGASWGIGREVSRELASNGFAIVLVYLDDQRRAEAVVDELLALGGSVVEVRADVTDDLDVERLFAETVAAFGGVDGVVHTGGVTRSVLERHRPGDAAILTVSAREQIGPLVTFFIRGDPPVE